MEHDRVTQEATPRVRTHPDWVPAPGPSPLTLPDSAATITADDAEMHRFRQGLGYGIVVNSGFFVTDIFMVTFISPGRLWVYALLRFGSSALALVVWLRLSAGVLPSRAVFRFWDIGLYSTVSACITLMMLESGGLGSLYVSGIVTVVLCRGAAQPDHWKRGVVSIGAPVATHFVTLLAATPFAPQLASQWHDSAVVASFVLNTAFLGAAVFFMIFAGHGAWALRQQVYEARRLGRYRLIQRIGAGAMGQVWIASHSTMKRNVAIKILQAAPGTNTALATARFEREVRATTELTHPNTVRIYDYGVTDDGLSYYAMELLVGDTLQHVIHRDGGMTPQRVIHVIAQAARSLAEAHAHGIIHRDVKPDNIILCEVGGESDFVKVIDFGIATLRDVEGGSLTRTGMAIGTPAYMAPEAVAGMPADERADIYALGCVAYFLLTGTIPDVRGHAGEMPPPPSSFVGVSDVLDALVMRCITRDPAARHQTMGDVVSALGDVMMNDRRVA